MNASVHLRVFTTLIAVSSLSTAHAVPPPTPDPQVRQVAGGGPAIRLVENQGGVLRTATNEVGATPLTLDAQRDAMLRRAPGLIPIEAGIEDRNGLQVSTRVMPPDLRLPLGFQRVYAIPGDSAHFVRGNGAIFAVFPRGTYRRAIEGGAPTLPPSTVFQFGDPTRDRWFGVTGAHQPEEMKVLRFDVADIVAEGATIGLRSKSTDTSDARSAQSIQSQLMEFIAPRSDETSVDRAKPFAKLRFGPAVVVNES